VGNALGWPVLSLGLGLLVFAAAGRDSLIGRREVPLAGWLAAISYSLYLVHKAIYHLVQAHWGAQLADGGFLAFAVYGGTALLAGAALYYTVERPFLQLRRRLQHSLRQPATATVA
jgi:peptidoglycan/LPS O-acetylase OafA/YrhL